MGVLNSAATRPHLYQTCQDPGCQRFGCRAYKEGVAVGRAQGEAIGRAQGEAIGYSRGHAEGMAEGAASASR